MPLCSFMLEAVIATAVSAGIQVQTNICNVSTCSRNLTILPKFVCLITSLVHRITGLRFHSQFFIVLHLILTVIIMKYPKMNKYSCDGIVIMVYEYYNHFLICFFLHCKICLHCTKHDR